MIYKSNQEKKKIEEESIIQLKEDTEQKEKEKNEKLSLESNELPTKKSFKRVNTKLKIIR